MQKWSAGEPGSAGLGSGTRANGAKPRKGGEREKEDAEGKERKRANDREVRSGRMMGDVQGSDQALLRG